MRRFLTHVTVPEPFYPVGYIVSTKSLGGRAAARFECQIFIIISSKGRILL